MTQRETTVFHEHGQQIRISHKEPFDDDPVNITLDIEEAAALTADLMHAVMLQALEPVYDHIRRIDWTGINGAPRTPRGGRMTAAELTDIIQSIAITTLAIGLILLDRRLKKLTEAHTRCKTVTPDGHWRCHLPQGHAGRHRARRSDGLHVLWPLHPSRSRPKAN